MSTVEGWIKEGSSEEVEVSICFDRALLGEFERVLEEYQTYLKGEKKQKLFGDAKGAMHPDDDPSEETAQRLVELDEAIKADEAEHVFRFRKMPYSEFRAIIEAHPPTDLQRQANRYNDHDPQAASPALVAGSCVEPRMSVEEAEELQAFLPESPWNELYTAAIRVNRIGVPGPKGAHSSVRELLSGLRSTMPADEGSRSASSGDE